MVEITLAQLAVQLEGTLSGCNADAVVTGICGLEGVGEEQVTFIEHVRLLEAAEASDALALIVPEAVTVSAKPLIRVRNPRAAFARALHLFDWRRLPLPGIDPTASVAKSAAVHARAHIGAYAVIGERTVIGEGAVISAHAVIGDHAEIGADTVIYPQVTIYPRCTLGRRVIVHAGAVVGADGHGYTPGSAGWEKIPQLGDVIIEDEVEIGANSTIDRATTGHTRIGRGTKIDNLVHIAHNVQVGPHSMIIAQVGIAGSSTLDEGVVIAGQAGVKDHVHIGARAQIAVRAGITRDVAPGAVMSGFPAQPHADELKQAAAVRRLPTVLAAVKTLEKKVAELEARLAGE